MPVETVSFTRERREKQLPVELWWGIVCCVAVPVLQLGFRAAEAVAVVQL